MPGELLIVGQGLAGTLLGWELERAGFTFDIADAGHRWAASRVAAGIINPITGHRIMKSWRVDTLLPIAREVYRNAGHELGVAVWRDMRVRRLYLNEEERRVFAEKQATGELAGFAGATDGDGFWIEGAAQVDLPRLIAAAREHWRRRGWLREECVPLEVTDGRYALVIVCAGAELRMAAGQLQRIGTGKPGAAGGVFGFVRWQFSKGEALIGRVDGLAPDVVVNRRYSLVPLPPDRAIIAATHAPARCDGVLTTEGRAVLEASLSSMTRAAFTCQEHQAGVRVYVADKKPVLGRHPANPRFGVFNGLGGKGALVAPACARQWVRHLVDEVPFDGEVDVARLWRRAPPSP